MKKRSSGACNRHKPFRLRNMTNHTNCKAAYPAAADIAAAGLVPSSPLKTTMTRRTGGSSQSEGGQRVADPFRADGRSDDQQQHKKSIGFSGKQPLAKEYAGANAEPGKQQMARQRKPQFLRRRRPVEGAGQRRIDDGNESKRP